MTGNDLIKIIEENNLENAEFRIYEDSLMFNLKREGKIDVNIVIDDLGGLDAEKSELCAAAAKTYVDNYSGEVVLCDKNLREETGQIIEVPWGDAFDSQTGQLIFTDRATSEKIDKLANLLWVEEVDPHRY